MMTFAVHWALNNNYLFIVVVVVVVVAAAAAVVAAAVGFGDSGCGDEVCVRVGLFFVVGLQTK